MKRVLFVILCYFTTLNCMVLGAEVNVRPDTITKCFTLINDSTFLFDYKPGDNDLYALVKNNKKECIRVSRYLKRFISEIESGQKVILVNSFVFSEDSDEQNKEMAYWISYRTKSWLIFKDGMKEEYFRTKNYVVKAIYDNYNKTLFSVVNSENASEKVILTESVQAVVQDSVQAVVQDSVQAVVQDSVQAVVQDSVQAVVQDSVQAVVQIEEQALKFAIKSNTLYWALLAPNIEIEWFIPAATNHWSLSAEGIVAWWRNKSKEKTYQIQQYSLEGRYWFNNSPEYSKHFVGVYANGGLYDLGRGESSGNRGEFCGAGAFYGYALPLKGSFRMEFQFGVGYIKSWFDRYTPMDGHHVYRATKEASYFGPTKAKISVGWILNGRKR